MSRSLIVFSFVSVLLLSCGGKKGSDYSPLNGDQKASFSATLESAGRTLDAASGAKHRTGLQAIQTDNLQTEMSNSLLKKQCLIQFTQNQNGQSITGNSSPSENPGTNPYPGLFSQNASGKTDYPTPGHSTANQSMAMDIKLSGDSCPASMDFHFDFRSNMSNSFGTYAKLNTHGNYSVKDDEYKKLNDVIGFNFDGGGEVRADRDGDRKAKVTSDFEIKGELTSQKQGKGSFEVTSKGTIDVQEDGAEGDIDNIILVKFSSYTAELKQVQHFEHSNGHTKVTSTYMLNGEEISAQEYRRYVGKFGGKLNTQIVANMLGN